MQVLSQQGDTVDTLCWRVYGSTSGMVEKVLDANPKLAFMPVLLPLGTTVNMPEFPNVKPETPQVQLWD